MFPFLISFVQDTCRMMQANRKKNHSLDLLNIKNGVISRSPPKSTKAELSGNVIVPATAVPYPQVRKGLSPAVMDRNRKYDQVRLEPHEEQARRHAEHVFALQQAILLETTQLEDEIFSSGIEDNKDGSRTSENLTLTFFICSLQF